MDLRDYLRLARLHWISIATLFVVSIVIALTYTLVSKPVFQSTAQVFVSTNQATDVTDLSQGTTYTQQIVKSYAHVLSTPIVLKPVIADLNLNLTPDQLARKISVDAPTDTVVLEISANDTSPSIAAAIANGVSQQLAKVVGTLSPSTGTASPVKVTSIEDAVVPTAPISPNLVLNLILGALIGLVLGVVVALLRETLDTRIRGERDIEQITDRPLLGGITFDPIAKQRPLIVQDDPRSPRAESFRSLRTNLQFLDFGAKSRAMVITSSIESEGKTTTATNLSIALADAGSKVVLVEADLRRPRLADYLGISAPVGLTDVLIGASSLDDALQAWGPTGALTVLAAGKLPPNPSELLQSRAMVALIDDLMTRFDTVIFDAPPLLPVTDAAILARLTSGAIMITAAGRARKAHLRASLTSLDQVDANVLGVVVTMLPTRGPDAYGYGRYGYGYGYGYGPTEKPTDPAAPVEAADRQSALVESSR